jgi:hypothetical protein
VSYPRVHWLAYTRDGIVVSADVSDQLPHGPHEYAGMTADELRCELVRRDAAAREFIAARELLCKQIDTLTKNLAKAEQKLQKQRSST